jgi:hypothetical protein
MMEATSGANFGNDWLRDGGCDTVMGLAEVDLRFVRAGQRCFVTPFQRFNTTSVVWFCIFLMNLGKAS